MICRCKHLWHLQQTLIMDIVSIEMSRIPLHVITRFFAFQRGLWPSFYILEVGKYERSSNVEFTLNKSTQKLIYLAVPKTLYKKQTAYASDYFIDGHEYSVWLDKYMEYLNVRVYWVLINDLIKLSSDYSTRVVFPSMINLCRPEAPKSGTFFLFSIYLLCIIIYYLLLFISSSQEQQSQKCSDLYKNFFI
jgi:hypothetical protein